MAGTGPRQLEGPDGSPCLSHAGGGAKAARGGLTGPGETNCCGAEDCCGGRRPPPAGTGFEDRACPPLAATEGVIPAAVPDGLPSPPVASDLGREQRRDDRPGKTQDRDSLHNVPRRFETKRRVCESCPASMRVACGELYNSPHHPAVLVEKGVQQGETVSPAIACIPRLHAARAPMVGRPTHPASRKRRAPIVAGPGGTYCFGLAAAASSSSIPVTARRPR